MGPSQKKYFFGNKNGMNYNRVESLNDDPEFIQAMADLVQDHLQTGEPSPQFKLRCPQCINPKCEATRSHFGA